MITQSDTYSLQDDHTWYYGRRSDGKVGMIPSNYIKERGEGTEKVTIVPQIPPRAQSGRMYVPEQGKAPAAKATEREERELYENTKLSHPADSYTVSITTHLFSIERADWPKLHEMFKCVTLIHSNVNFRWDFRFKSRP